MVGTNALVSTFVLREIVGPYFEAFKDNLIQNVWCLEPFEREGPKEISGVFDVLGKALRGSL